MLKIGILGTAHGHADSYAEEVNAHPGAELIGVWDDNAERREASASKYGTAAFDTVDALCTATDAVIVCSENVYHRTLTETAARHGKPMLCEKPLATTPTDAHAMITDCEAAGVSLFTAFPCRFSPAFVALRDAAHRGDLGEILAVRGTNRGKCPFGWFVDTKLSGGGAVMDHTVHVADLLRVLLRSEVSTVFCEADNRMFSGDFDDTGIVNLTFESGVFATIDCSWSRPAQTFPTWGDVTLGVQGTRASVEMDMLAQGATLYNEGAARIQTLGYGSGIDGGMVAAFIHAMQTGEPGDLATGTDGLRTVEIVAAAYESVRTHQPVVVKRLSGMM
ncbi:MAG: Gfo/Idh/MocA family oxidoreductase [Armatimonadetes bacterium]|nr:Gfo/Idh/MocA family oxidoreductase [Armatimonadota bacterium]